MANYQRLTSVGGSQHSASEDDFGENIDMADLHGTHKNIVDPVAQSSQRSDSQNCPLNVVHEIGEQIIGKEENTYRNIKDAFRAQIYVLVIQLIHEKQIGNNPKEREIVDTVVNLTEYMRRESPTHFSNFVQRLTRAFDGAQEGVEPVTWFSLSFEELVKKVGEVPSWRSFANMINCIYIIKEVAEKYGHYNQELKEAMENCLNGFINDKYRVFVTDSGGWDNLVEYYKHVQSYEDRAQSTNWFGAALIPAAAVIVGGLAFLRS